MATVNTLIMTSLCLLGLNKEATVQELQPSPRDHIATFLHWPTDVIVHQCSEEDQRHLAHRDSSISKGNLHAHPQTLCLPTGNSCCQHGHLQKKVRKFSFTLEISQFTCVFPSCPSSRLSIAQVPCNCKYDVSSSCLKMASFALHL